MARDPVTHDYSRPGWGHATETMDSHDGGKRLELAGHGRGVAVGDYLILPNGGGRTTRYVVDKIKYERDPDDMWFADVTFAPRLKSEKGDAA